MGDLQTFFFSSTPFSASELQKRENRFTLDIQRGGGREKMVKSPRLLERGMLLRPHQQAEVNWGGCALSKPPLQPRLAGLQQVNSGLCEDLLPPRSAQGPALPCLAAQSADHLEAGRAPAHTLPALSQVYAFLPGNPAALCLPGLCHLVTFCCSYPGPTLGGCYLSKHLLGKWQSLTCLHNHPPRPGGIISPCDMWNLRLSDSNYLTQVCRTSICLSWDSNSGLST